MIAMLPLQFSFAQTYYYEDSTNHDSEVFIYEYEDAEESSWYSNWHMETTSDGDETVTQTWREEWSSDDGELESSYDEDTYESTADTDARSNWRERWNNKDGENDRNDTDDNSRSNWRERWNNNNSWDDTWNDDIDDWRDDWQTDISSWNEEFDEDLDDWRDDWNDDIDDWRDDWGDNDNGHGNDDDDCDEDNPGNSYNHRDCDEDDTTRAEAASAITEAAAAIEDLKDDIEEMEVDDADQDEIDEAQDVLDAAEDKLADAREHFTDTDYDEAKEAAEDVIAIIDEYRDDTDNDDDDIPEACMLSENELDDITNYPPQNGPIVAFGDSLTAGVGASSGQDYVSELEKLIDEDIINAGVRGDTTEEALDRLEEDVLSHDPRAVIVWLGGNDLLARYFEEIEERAEDDSIWEDFYEAILRLFGREPNNNEVLTENETFNNLKMIVERIQDAGAVVILVGIDGEPLDNDLSERYEDVAEDTGAIFVDDVLQGIIGRASLTNDFIHPNNAGYEIVAERIFEAVACVVDVDEEDEDDEDDDYSSDWRTRWTST